MASTPNSIITPQTPVTAFCDLTTNSAVSSRAPASASTNLTQFSTSVSLTNGCQINSIIVRGAATSLTAATQNMSVLIYEYDGTSKYWVVDEITITAQTPSTTLPAITSKVSDTDWILAPGHTLWAGVTVTVAAATYALTAQMNGGAL